MTDHPQILSEVQSGAEDLRFRAFCFAVERVLSQTQAGVSPECSVNCVGNLCLDCSSLTGVSSTGEGHEQTHGAETAPQSRPQPPSYPQVVGGLLEELL